MAKFTENKVFLDIEISPTELYTYGYYDPTVLGVKKEWEITSFSVKQNNKFITHSVRNYSEEELLRQLWDILDNASIVIAHNGDKFDVKKINSRFIKYDMTPPSPYKTVDTLKVARKHFGFTSNRLDDLGEFMGVGRKQNTPKNLWLQCINGDTKAYKILEKYNEKDVRLLEKIYYRLLPWIDNHPPLGGDADSPMVCPNCGSEHLQRRGTARNKTREYQRYQCIACGTWSRGELLTIRKTLTTI